MKELSHRDMVRVSSGECEGCGICCKGMGDTIRLDPYDGFLLTFGTGRSFTELLGEAIGLSVENGVTLPFLMMAEETDACSYLGEDGRCRIHLFRPGLCRMFPLGREYTENGCLYFVVENACPKKLRTKVRIDRWIGIPDMRAYEEFKRSWHFFLIKVGNALEKEGGAFAGRVSTYRLKQFYLTPYEGDDFYTLYRMRLKAAMTAIGIR